MSKVTEFLSESWIQRNEVADKILFLPFVSYNHWEAHGQKKRKDLIRLEGLCII